MLAFGIPSLREDEGERPRLAEKLLKALKAYLAFKKGKIAKEPWTRVDARGRDVGERWKRKYGCDCHHRMASWALYLFLLLLGIGNKQHLWNPTVHHSTQF